MPTLPNRAKTLDGSGYSEHIQRESDSYVGASVDPSEMGAIQSIVTEKTNALLTWLNVGQGPDAKDDSYEIEEEDCPCDDGSGGQTVGASEDVDFSGHLSDDLVIQSTSESVKLEAQRIHEVVKGNTLEMFPFSTSPENLPLITQMIDWFSSTSGHKYKLDHITKGGYVITQISAKAKSVKIQSGQSSEQRSTETSEKYEIESTSTYLGESLGPTTDTDNNQSDSDSTIKTEPVVTGSRKAPKSIAASSSLSAIMIQLEKGVKLPPKRSTGKSTKITLRSFNLDRSEIMELLNHGPVRERGQAPAEETNGQEHKNNVKELQL